MYITEYYHGQTNTMITVRAIPAFDDNYIWFIGSPNNNHVAIVDPGDEDPVIESIEREQLKPVAILITHHHGDHTGGVQALVDRYSLPVYGPAHERIPALTHPLKDGDRVELAELDLHFEVLETPGHTKGHLCYYGHQSLFCGDTLFTAGCGRLFEGSPEQMHASLERLLALPADTQVYCAHEYTLANLGFALVVEPDNADILQRRADTEALRREGRPSVPSTLELERRTNPFMRTDLRVVIGAAEAFAGRHLDTGAEVFGVVRHWKDTLD